VLLRTHTTKAGSFTLFLENKSHKYNESRAADWYLVLLTKGPQPKLIITGATIHSMCVTFGPLGTCMFYVRIYRGKADEDIKIN
jgi:hypothetical protein